MSKSRKATNAMPTCAQIVRLGDGQGSSIRQSDIPATSSQTTDDGSGRLKNPWYQGASITLQADPMTRPQSIKSTTSPWPSVPNSPARMAGGNDPHVPGPGLINPRPPAVTAHNLQFTRQPFAATQGAQPDMGALTTPSPRPSSTSECEWSSMTMPHLSGGRA